MSFKKISNSAKVENKIKLLEEISTLIAALTNKSRKFVIAILEDNSNLFFEDQSSFCFIEIKSIGFLKTSDISKAICSFVYEKMVIQIDKTYICFENVPPEMLGWNSGTFG